MKILSRYYDLTYEDLSSKGVKLKKKINEAKLSFPGLDLVVDSIHALWCRCQIFPRNHHMKLHLQQCKGPKTNWSRLKKNGATGRRLHCKLGFPIKRTSGLVNLTRSILICHRYIDSVLHYLNTDLVRFTKHRRKYLICQQVPREIQNRE